MEWYFCNEVEDVVVPKDYEQPEESWSQWGITSFGGSDFPKKNFNSATNITREELTFNGGKNFYTSIDMADSNNGRQSSNNSSMNQALYNNGGSLLWNDQADFQQFTEEEARINHMDDLFFNSLLEEDPGKDSSKIDEDSILANNVNVFEGEMVNSHSIGSHGQSMGSSKYLKTHDFSPPMEWGSGEGTTPKQHMNEENSMEESVLQDLERVTAQFTDKTRICFRDALYRLAESSKQSVHSCHEPEPMLASSADPMRAGETEVSELETNVIDRAVANLMFNKFDLEEGGGTAAEHLHCRQRQAVSCYQNPTHINGDAEVPIAGGHGLPQPTAY